MRRLALAAVLLLGACSAGPAPSEVVPRSAAAPQPANASTVSAAPSSSAAPPACDATASLRPGPLPQAGQMPAGSTMATIAQRGRLIAGVDQNSYLMGFRNSFTGEIEGFDVDVARQIAKAIFGDEKKVQFRVVTAAERIPMLQSGAVDVVVRTMTITCERLRDVDFSQVYYQAGQRVLVRRNSGIAGVEGLADKRVCVASGSTSLGNVVNRAKTTVSVPNWTDCLVMLQQGQTDAISTDDTILAGLAAQDPYTEVVGARFTDESYGVGVPKGQEDLVRFVNGVLERMRADGTWSAIYGRWLTPLGPAPTPPVARYRD
ncbi:amino acid ABC transporter substrate-binding protein, PAAT family [Lentzea albidocapillata subsp. violacea]|uniref:Amino acid ABC transporter substrate-binding protein, PAAT family n=1 Tax=Lentzea albidocapillata subsp. violacea TaxID=128104 RepID=A0A1G8S113_9PSEU|nr:glutamate ABC transporter substrate-binding protein [Lentzea albidocapillata]SDJ22841.1 amino acid ABC transporter substrate-binding protein, PAAT family [Lentzea albidocapillata subsp. violacea]